MSKLKRIGGFGGNIKADLRVVARHGGGGFSERVLQFNNR